MVLQGEESASTPASVPHTITPSYVLARPQHLVEKQEGTYSEVNKDCCVLYVRKAVPYVTENVARCTFQRR